MSALNLLASRGVLYIPIPQRIRWSDCAAEPSPYMPPRNEVVVTFHQRTPRGGAIVSFEYRKLKSVPMEVAAERLWTMKALRETAQQILEDWRYARVER
jgi:hypothetical protein